MTTAPNPLPQNAQRAFMGTAFAKRDLAAQHPHVIATYAVSKYPQFQRVESTQDFGAKRVVICDDRYAVFGILQSTVHDLWTAQFQSHLLTTRRYTPGECFVTFPFPPESAWGDLEAVGEAYHIHRAPLVQPSDIAMARTYNRFHNAADTASDIAQLRTLHQQLDLAVLSAYGWIDLDPRHHFYPTDNGDRFTFHPDAAADVLQRLLALNLAGG